jgi:solute:Na+ symporter, SSS family
MTTALSFIFFTGLVAVVSWWKTHNDDQESSTGYFLAGRSLSWFVVGGSLLLTNLSTEQLVGLNGGAYRNGMIVMAWEVWSALAIVLMAVVFLPRYLKSGITTIPEFLELRYNSKTRTFTSVIFLASIILNVLPFVLLTGAEFMISVFDVPSILGTDSKPVNLAVVCSVLALVGGCYAVFGGLKAVAVSDTVNGVGLVIGGLLIPILGLNFIGNGDMLAGVSLLTETYPERLSSLGDRAADIPWETLLTGMTLITTYYWCTNQGIVQRTLASKNLAEGQKGVLFAAVMKLAGPLYLVLPGIIAWHIAFGTDQAPPANADAAYGYLVNLVLPGWAVGFFAAAIFGAILSSFNSFLNSGSALFSLDLYRGEINKEATDEQVVRMGKRFGVVMIPVSVVLALVLSPFAESGLFNLMKSIAAVLNVPLLAIVFVGIVSRRASASAAHAALLGGIVFQSVFGIAMGNSLFGLQMHWLHLAAVNFSFLVLLMLVISVVQPRGEAYQQKYSEDVDITPWKLAKPVGALIIVLIAMMYVGFAWQFGITPGEQLAAEYEQLHPAAAVAVE